MSAFQHNLKFTETDPPIKGFQEAVLSVSNLERSMDFYQRICGWQLISRHQGGDDLKHLWQLDSSVEIEEALFMNPGDKEGFLRLVQFHNVEQQQIRSAAHAWDTGGLFDINIRAKDANDLYRSFQQEGWNGYGDPLRYTFGEYDVSEVLIKGPDGVTIAIIQRFSPPLQGFVMNRTSRIFNASIISIDAEETYNFFVNKLGFKLFFKSSGDARNPGANVLGIPANINSNITVPVYIVRPDINNYGSIEFLELKELKGKDCSTFAKPPNLGILLLRFPVADADAYAAKLKKNGLSLNTSVQTLAITPYGKVKAFSVLSPDGVWLEFIELVS